MHGSQVCRAQPPDLAKDREHFSPKNAPDDKSSLRRMWERYVGKTTLPGRSARPGRCIGDDPALAAFMEVSNWPYRASSYELYFASPSVLARSVYGLAIRSGDVDRTMPLERFEKGVLGFHYSTAQVCAWINAILAEQMPVNTVEERQLIVWLLKNSVVDISNGAATPGLTIRHILGAAPGKKRGFEDTLRHERLHVLWDEDPAFAAGYQAQWSALSESEKQAARERLSAYSQSNEAQLIEEWAIKHAESMPEKQRKALVGL
jgi:hypothetical protein